MFVSSIQPLNRATLASFLAFALTAAPAHGQQPDNVYGDLHNC